MDFTQEGTVIDIETRETLFGLFAGVTFIIAMAASLFAIILYSALNLTGVDNAVWFAQEFWWMINKPGLLMIISIITMLASSFFSVGGLYPPAVNYACWSVGAILFIFLGYVFVMVDKKVKDHLNVMLIEMEQKRK